MRVTALYRRLDYKKRRILRALKSPHMIKET
jgi:hypothetical protein